MYATRDCWYVSGTYAACVVNAAYDAPMSSFCRSQRHVSLCPAQVTVTAVTPNASRTAHAVGALNVTVLPGGELSSFDGTSSPCNSSVVVQGGSWGDVVCDGTLQVCAALLLCGVLHCSLRVCTVPPPPFVCLCPQTCACAFVQLD